MEKYCQAIKKPHFLKHVWRVFFVLVLNIVTKQCVDDHIHTYIYIYTHKQTNA